MEDQKILEDLDSLWFFSNILSSSPTLPSFTLLSDEEPTQQSHLSESPKSDHQNPRFSVLQTEQVQSTSTDSEVETSSDFDSVFESETESEIQEMESLTMMEQPLMEKKEERSRGHVRATEDMRNYGFDFGDIGLEYLLVPMIPKLPKSGNPHLVCKMPSLSDGMAMKKHLRLWAHAVACTVK